MEQPLVSIVLPAYNGEKTLHRCVESILAQRYSPLELWVVDDGSTDGTLAIVKQFEERDSRVHALHQQNGGVAAARNMALAHCTGTYVQFVDCDDLLPDDSTEKLVRRMLRDDSDMVIGAFVMRVGHVREKKDLAKRDDCLSTDDFLAPLSKAPNSFYYGVVWNKLFRRALIESQQVRFNPELAWGEDFDFCTRYLVDTRRIAYTSEAVYEYVKNSWGLTLQTGVEAVLNPVKSIRLKHVIYESYCELYRKRGQYERYRGELWKYMFGTTLTN